MINVRRVMVYLVQVRNLPTSPCNLPTPPSSRDLPSPSIAFSRVMVCLLQYPIPAPLNLIFFPVDAIRQFYSYARATCVSRFAGRRERKAAHDEKARRARLRALRPPDSPGGSADDGVSSAESSRCAISPQSPCSRGLPSPSHAAFHHLLTRPSITFSRAYLPPSRAATAPTRAWIGSIQSTSVMRHVLF